MFALKRFLLLGSLGLTLLVGLMFTSATSGFHIASAAGCNTTTKGSWSNNCLTDDTVNKDTNFVIAIQTVVNHSGHGCSAGTIDGDFGQNTFDGVMCFQRNHGLSADGQVGPNTWGKLEGILICTGNPPHALECSLPGTGTLFTAADAGIGVWQVFDPVTQSFVTMNTSDSN
jgi:hypothetical protein